MSLTSIIEELNGACAGARRVSVCIDAARNEVSVRLFENDAQASETFVAYDHTAESKTAACIRIREAVRHMLRPKSKPVVIDLTPTWTEWSALYARLAESGERDAVRRLRPDLFRMARACDALQAIRGSLTPEQRAIVDRIQSA